MPRLASFISYRPRLKSRSHKSPFSGRRLDSLSPTTHPYASPDIFDINDIPLQAQIPMQEVDGADVHSQYHETDADADVDVADIPEAEVKPAIESSPPSLPDWFPSDFLKTEPLTLLLECTAAIESGRNGDTETSGNRNDMGNDGVDGAGVRDGKDEQNEEDEESSSTSENMQEIVANLEAMDVRCGFHRSSASLILLITHRPPTL
jgi:hypothetical protein